MFKNHGKIVWWLVVALLSSAMPQGPTQNQGSSSQAQGSQGSSSPPGGQSQGKRGPMAGMESAATNPETMCINYLLGVYPAEQLTRPSRPSEMTNVTLSLTINSFDGVDDLAETMNFAGIIVAKWKDNYLRWDIGDYPGVNYVHLRFKDVWLPLFMQSSAPDSIEPVFFADQNANSDVLFVLKGGNVTAVTAGNYYTQCDLDLTLFPFDSQSCSYTFQAMDYTYDYLYMLPEDVGYKVTDSNALISPQWILTDISVSEELAYFLENPYSCLTYTFTAARRPLFYVLNVLLPCVLMATLALATFMFPFCSDRAVYAMTVVLGFAVYQTVVTQALPTTATKIPLVLYIISEMIISTFISFHSIIVTWAVSRYANSGRPLPPCLANIYCVAGQYYPSKATQKYEAQPSLPASELSVKIIKKINTQQKASKYSDQWLSFFNFVDTVFMIICIIASVLLPVLMFSTNIFYASDQTVISPVKTNYVTRFYAITTHQTPSIADGLNNTIGQNGPGGGDGGPGGPGGG